MKEIFGKNIELVEIIKILEKNLKEKGIFLIAVDNKFGLRYFTGNPENILNKKFESITGYSNEKEKIETYTKKKIEKLIKNIEYKVNFYYPLPDYKIPNVIFSDKQLAKYNSVDKYNVYYNKNSDILMNEIDVFREILKSDEEMFTFFANSFLMEISKTQIPIKYKYISFNNMRKEKYRLITKITDQYVEKEPVNIKAKEHYDLIRKNIRYMKSQNINTVDFEENDGIKSKYISQEKLLNNIITKALENNDQNMVENVMNTYIEKLKMNTYKEEAYQNTVFAKYGIKVNDTNLIKKMHFQKKGLWDMTFKNCFYINKELFFFDQEWEEENLPVEYILYRSILYTISLRRFINIEDWLKKYDLIQFRELFEKLDNKIQEKIRNDVLWDFYSKNKFFDIDGTKQELINMQIRSEAQKAAFDNLKHENDNLKMEYEQYRRLQEEKFTNKVKRKVKKILGGKNE